MPSPLPSTLHSSGRPVGRDRRRLPALTVVSAMFVAALGAVAPNAQAASVTSAVFSGGAGTYTPSNGAVYARQGAALTLTVQADADTKCVTVNARQDDGSLASVDMERSGTSPFAFTTGLDIFTAGAGNGLVQVMSVVGYKQGNGRKCVANQGETYSQTPGYTLDNTAPTATGVVTPAPNAAGWNKTDPTITWSATDAGGSGVKTIDPASHTVATEGTSTRSTSVTDHVGNSATSAPVTVKVDKSVPTIVASRTPAANAEGWNNTDVTVSFTGADREPGSGVKSTTGPTTLSTSAANQSVTGTVVDHADHSASTTVSGINIDKVAPTLSGTPKSAPNAAGWYRGDVVVGWTATDALSGTSNPADSTITGEGVALTASSTATDRAGNSSGSVQSAPAVKIDRTAPNTTVMAPPAWNKTDVTLTLVPHDGLSGVAQTFSRLDGADAVPGTSVPVSSEGAHTLTFWSTDAAGNAEAPHTVEFGIDKTSPTIGHTQDPAANADGWNNGDVTITFECSDAVSGVASCTGPQTVSAEGHGQVVTGTVTDRAGNSATDPASVSIDKTKPVISVDALPAPNANGWYDHDVTATYTASDALSGVKTQDRSHTFGEGAGQSDTATATDAAGNSASVTTPKVNVDKTAPTITGTVVDVPNADGWFAGDVTVTWTCTDNLSGVVACPEDSVVTGEGSNRSVSASVSDKAGHTTTATVTGIGIDRTAPATSTTDVPGGWVKAPVTVGFSGTDNLSGVSTTWFAVDGASTPTAGDEVTIGDEGEHTVTYWSVDSAGNREASQSFTVRLDLSSPTILLGQAPEKNANGWNNTDVSVSSSCADQVNLSGLASCSAPQTVTTEGKGQAVSGTATDNAGNSTTGTATVDIDKTAPVITGAPDRAANAAGWYRDDVIVSFTGKDGLSGIDTVTPPVRLTEGANQSVEGTATDNAGNAASTTVSDVDIDKTAPVLSAAPTASPNENGWYNADVTQTWSADDALSGLVGDKPEDALLTHEGEGQTVSASVSDRAGNTTSATSAPVRIDKTAPSTAVSAPSGWVNTGVDVTLTPTDALSGVSSTHYRVDDGAWTVGDEAEQTVVPLTSEGTHTIEFFSGDLAGNREAARTVTVLIDRSNPTITHELDPAANGNGWNNGDVTVTFTCRDQDGLSGVASCTAPQLVTAEGADQPVTGTATDVAGNTATDPATVSLDRTKPTIVGSRTPSANAAGWNNTDVTVHFVGGDALSGIASVTPDTTLGEGTAQSVEGTAVDAADNSATVTVGGINVDQTAPTLSGAPTTAANAKGWYRGDVVIGWTAADARSGIAATPADSTLTGEGAGLRASATVLDRAGNDTTAQSAPVNIDRTAPTTGADAPAGWNNGEVTVSLEPSDGLSGVDATYYRLDGGEPRAGTSLTVGTEGVHTLSYWSVDEAGNVEAARTATVRIDLTMPTVRHTVTPKPNGNGWNRTPVSVAYQCDDALSGVASCSPAVDVTSDGANQAVPGTAVDEAGNSRTVDARVSIDTVLPTVTGAPDRAPNGNSWYAGDVEVSFTCADALSGIADCSPSTTLGEGEGQNARGSAADAAGNTAETTVGPVNVDKTAPTLRGAATTAPNGAGWYNDDVTVRWTAADALSGLEGAAPGDSIISSEGDDLTAGASVRDLAGNETSASSAPVRIDRTAPATTVSNVSDWSGQDVTVTLTPTDNLSGVVATRHQLDDEEVADGTEVTIDTEGVHQLKVWSVDRAGNVEAHKNVEVKIDRTAPGISHTQAPVANERGWNRSDVTVTFTCTDSGSGLASCTEPTTVSSEGQHQPVSGKAVDKAGNTATDPATVSIDRTAPTVTGSLSADANGHGWFNAAVTATFTCADQQGLSGVLSCPAERTLGEGRGQSAGGTATDAADNESDAFSLTGINVDTTAPSLGGATTTAPNAAGWFRGDVTVRWTASDSLSGLDGAAPVDSTVTGEGDSLSAGASVTDKAGNTTGASVGGIRIDRTAPSTTATAPSGWQAGDVTVTLSGQDALSGVASTHFSVDGGERQTGTTVTVAGEGSHRVAFWSVDKAGNTEAASTVTVLVDKSAPTITGAATTAPNDAGWYNAPVTVHFDCADAVSGIASCQPDATLAAQGVNTVTGAAVDNAGNTATTTVGGIKVDTVAPVITIGGVVDGATYTLGAVPAATVSAADATSGLVSPASGATTGGLSNGVGTFTHTATATDRAGNVGRVSATYRVVYGYGSTLFLQPVNDTAHQTGLSTSVFNAGQTIPMKFQLKNAAGGLVQTGSAPKWLVPVKGSSTNAAVNEAAYTDSATSGGSYIWNGTQYQYNWKTEKSQAGSYWRVGVSLDDGQTYYVNVALR